MVECLSVNQKIWVRFPLITFFLYNKHKFFLRLIFLLCLNSSVVEHWTENPRVVGSIPALSKAYSRKENVFSICFKKFISNLTPAWRNGRRARLKI
jgi:hypothetical protein